MKCLFAFFYAYTRLGWIQKSLQGSLLSVMPLRLLNVVEDWDSQFYVIVEQRLVCQTANFTKALFLVLPALYLL